jgi:hypothetical protein
MIQVATFKLAVSARAFYNGSLEPQRPNVTWATFKTASQTRFRDVGTDLYHFTQLQMSRQKSGETRQELADRCRDLSQRTVPHV